MTPPAVPAAGCAKDRRPLFPTSPSCQAAHKERIQESLQSIREPASGGAYGFLQRVDEVLQVNVVPVGSDVALEKLPKPVSHPVLEQEGQHSHSQLQEEDEHDGATELQGHKDGSRVTALKPPSRTHSLTGPRTTAYHIEMGCAPERPTLQPRESYFISWVAPSNSASSVKWGHSFLPTSLHCCTVKGVKE